MKDEHPAGCGGRAQRPSPHLTAAAEMTKQLIRDDADSTIVLHVQKLAVPRLTRLDAA